MSDVKVYADICLLINFFMDLGIFWATAKLAGALLNYRRLIAASLVGAIYGAGILFYPFHIIYSPPGKIVFSVLLVILALSPRGRQQLKKGFLFFYAVSFTVAGASLAASYLLNIGSLNISYSYLYLFGGLLCVIFIGVLADQYFYDHVLPGILHYDVQFHFGDQTCCAQAFLDTGNGLRDPLSQRPVIVAEYGALQPCFPNDLALYGREIVNENEFLEALSQSSWANRLRLIPFSSIGQKNGLLIGVRCDEFVVDTGKKKLIHKNLVVCMYLDKLSFENHYQALIPSELLMNA